MLASTIRAKIVMFYNQNTMHKVGVSPVSLAIPFNYAVKIQIHVLRTNTFNIDPTIC